jgi:NitT/TauT family transport system substrate-binding protein
MSLAQVSAVGFNAVRKAAFGGLAAAAIAALPTGLAVGTAQAQALEKLRMTIPVHAFVFYPVYAAVDKGYFKEAGIEMEIIPTQGDGPDVDALIAGSVQFTTSTPNRLLTAYEQGKPLKAVMAVSSKMQINCFVNKETAAKAGMTPNMALTDKLPKLKGMTLAGTRPGSFSYLVGIDYIMRGGLKPQDDVKIIGAGGGTSMIAAVENKQADLACSASPVPELAIARGKSEWFVNNSVGEDPLFPELLFETVYVRPEYAKTNADTVRKVLNAMVKASQWILKATPEEHLALLKPRFESVEDDVILASVNNAKNGITATGCITPGQVEGVVKFLQRTEMMKGTVPASAVADNSFLPSPCN